MFTLFAVVWLGVTGTTMTHIVNKNVTEIKEKAKDSRPQVIVIRRYKLGQVK